MITERDVAEVLDAVGLQEGDIVTVHSFLGAFGLFEEGPNTIVEAFKTVLGTVGTLVMPTYTIHFLSTGYYDHNNTQSKVGILTERFRKSPGVVRTLDPVYSHAVWGAKQKDYGAIRTRDILGPNSLFASLLSDNATHVLFGTTMDRGCTTIHHFERMVLAPYRFLKTFSGTVIKDNVSYEAEVDHYARYLDDPVVPNFNPLEQELLQRRLAKRAVLGRGRVLAFKTQDLHNLAAELYEKDPYALVRKANV